MPSIYSVLYNVAYVKNENSLLPKNLQCKTDNREDKRIRGGKKHKKEGMKTKDLKLRKRTKELSERALERGEF